MKPKLLLIDGNSLINRAYYAFGGGGGLTWNGAPTNATYGFLNMFFKAIADTNPSLVAVAFDMRAKTFRHKMFDGYKAARKSMPDELAVQLNDLKDLLKIMQVIIIECEGYEADDIIGTLSKACSHQTIILSADRDGLQLVDSCTELHLTKTGVTNLDIWDEARIKQEYNLTPAQFIDLKALMGDKSDNIPGAQGVGEKTALSLMQEYGNLENIFANLDKIRDSLRDKLSASENIVYLSRDLARINTEVPVNCDTDKFVFPYPMNKSVYDAFYERGFKSLCKRPNLWDADYYSSAGGENIESKIDNPPLPIEAKVIEIKNIEELEKLVKNLMSAKILVNTCDKEAIYLASDEKIEYKILIQIDLLSGGLTIDEINNCLKLLYESQIPKIVWDSKQLKERLSTYNIKLNNVVIDIKLCDHLLTTGVSFSTPQELFAKYKITNQGAAAPVFRINFLEKLQRAGMLPLYQQIELPLVDILIKMQQCGAKIDLTALQNESAKLQAQISDLTAQIYNFAGTTFNINSPQQLGEILFKKLGVQTTRKTKTGFSTDEYELQKKAGSHPIVPHILRYRKIFKLYSTYIQGFKNLADADGFVHSTFHNTVTVTGRLSSSEPNIQNIPARSDDADIIRKLFISRFPNGKIIAADYSQIELRLLAHFSGDEVMKNAFKNSRDIHTETAVKIFGVDTNLITSDMRRQAKAVNFGIVYGISAFGLSESIGCSVSDASHFIEKYFAQFPRIKIFLDKCRDDAIMNGYAATLLGRRRHLPELSSSNHNTVQFGTRAAMNMPMQGSASDIIKKAMVEIGKKLDERYGTDCAQLLKPIPVIIAQVHDELVFDCPPDEIETVSGLIKQVMENVVSLSVPLTVDIEVKDTF